MIEHAYIHIPFCIRKCNYCSFVSGYNINLKNEYINSLLKEIKTKYKNEKLKTLYFGGGTPSLLEVEDIQRIISLFNFQENPEITLETNPETVTFDKFINFNNIGINRISLGAQSFDNTILKIIGRNHSEKTIFKALDIIKDANFNNISIDLIYGLPSQTMDILEQDLDKILSCDIKHVSTYGLKIDENSFFYKHPPLNLPNDEKQAEMYIQICNKLKNNSFIHYEISNFSKDNFQSIHNNAYWLNKNYYGFGLNASGYEKNVRYRNISDFKEYIKNPTLKEEENILTKNEILEDEIFLALRLNKGININEINNKYNINFLEKYNEIIDKYSKLNLLIIQDNICKLTLNGILLSNNIMCEFITTD